jgi:nucleotide-binding universal stress UspA family protein
MREIVVGVDGSQESRCALDRALHMGQVMGRPLVVAHVWCEPSPAVMHGIVGALADARSQASAVVDTELAQALHRFPGEAHVRFRDHVAPGPSGPVLTSLAEEAGLIVLGAHERHRMLGSLGSTVTHTLHHSECPLMVVPPLGDSTRPFRRVVVGVDGSAGSRSALRWARDIAARDNAAVEIVHVVQGEREAASDPRAVLRATVPEVDDEGLAIRVMHGDPGLALSLAATTQDLLVVGSRGTGHFAALVLGSVSAQVVMSPQSAVVVVRAEGERLEDLAQAGHTERVAQS